jgi:hypothetical protein
LCKYSVTEVEDTLYVLRDCSFANLDAIITWRYKKRFL